MLVTATCRIAYSPCAVLLRPLAPTVLACVILVIVKENLPSRPTLPRPPDVPAGEDAVPVAVPVVVVLWLAATAAMTMTSTTRTPAPASVQRQPCRFLRRGCCGGGGV